RLCLRAQSAGRTPGGRANARPHGALTLPRPRVRPGTALDLPWGPQARGRPLAHVFGRPREGRALLGRPLPGRPRDGRGRRGGGVACRARSLGAAAPRERRAAGRLPLGGIDSSAVAALAARHLPGRLKTFSIGFEDPSFDETAHARSVARGLDADHHEEILGPRAALDLVARLPELLDEPLGDASLLPTFLLPPFA